MQLDYGNWVRKKILLILGLCALVTGALIFIPLGSAYKAVTTVLFVILFVSFLFPLYVYVMFSQSGGKLQEKVYNIAIHYLGKGLKGNFIDIGSGNGVLAVTLAQKYEAIEVTGVDYWGTDWEYSKSVCEKNAQIVKVENRVHFQKGDAALLDFADNTFDGAISNLTFHEVKSVPDKKLVVQEALRVVKSGGSFSFIDYFFDEKYYGTALELEKFLKCLNLEHFERKHLKDVIPLPAMLQHPKILGKVGIIFGKK
ncbi:MAG: class I SAM-dependent methyltransferase [Caldilineales bacterium]|nr:class I SAM-dependent methyltransferase [Caldilineales bacterium]MCW5856982.1 class I SAM-dependent methyltransferase [Caldilineales bacterium]